MQVMEAGDEVRRPFGPVGIEAIPDQHARPLQFLVEVAEEVNDSCGTDLGLGMQAKVEPRAIAAGRHRQGCNGRYLSQMTPPLNQHRRLAPRLPTAANQWPHQQPAFIQEDQPGVQPVGFFLRAGQVCLTQRRISSSSRSTARRAGFCGLQPSAWSKRPIWST